MTDIQQIQARWLRKCESFAQATPREWSANDERAYRFGLELIDEVWTAFTPAEPPQHALVETPSGVLKVYQKGGPDAVAPAEPQTPEPCGCSFDPTNMNDYCAKHRPLIEPAAPVSSDARPARTLEEVIAQWSDSDLMGLSAERQKSLVAALLAPVVPAGETAKDAALEALLKEARACIGDEWPVSGNEQRSGSEQTLTVSEWKQAVYTAMRVSDEVDMDATLDALILAARGLGREEAQQEIDALRAQLTGTGHVPYLDRMATLVARAEAAEAEVTRLKTEIDKAWFGIENGWDIEERAYFEQEARTNGFDSPLAMAVHHMWKREPKPKFPDLSSRLAQQEQAQGWQVPCMHSDKFRCPSCPPAPQDTP